jgi:hypothetical protein
MKTKNPKFPEMPTPIFKGPEVAAELTRIAGPLRQKTLTAKQRSDIAVEIDNLVMQLKGFPNED